MGHVMSDFPKIQLLSPKRGMPPKHFADLSEDERIEALGELGLPKVRAIRSRATTMAASRRTRPR